MGQCHYRRAVDLTTTLPYAELASYLAVHRHQVEQVFRTLSYFDGLNFAQRAEAPSLFSVGLMDPVCPPSTVFAAFNHYRGPHEIRVWPFSGHEAPEGHHQVERYAFLERQGVAPGSRERTR